jgi:TPR repeat protein
MKPTYYAVLLVLVFGMGCGESKEHATAPTTQFAETKAKAEAGDVEAQNNLGVMYF